MQVCQSLAGSSNQKFLGESRASGHAKISRFNTSTRHVIGRASRDVTLSKRDVISQRVCICDVRAILSMCRNRTILSQVC